MKLAFICLALSTALLAAVAAEKRENWRADIQLRAMSDELARTKTLSLGTLDKPYFVQYTSEDAESFVVSAELGGIIHANRFHRRRPGIEIRVGDYAFDNTNFVSSGNLTFGLLPLDDDYGVMRTVLWGASDGAYKAALNQIAQKRNALREIAEPDKTPDLAPAESIQMIEPVENLQIDQSRWTNWVRDASQRFVSHPDVLASSVRLEAHGLTYRLVNSEGTMVRIPQSLAELQIRASTKTGDGRRVWNQYFQAALDASTLPQSEDLAKIAETVAAQTDELRKAPLAENYTGPVLFEKEAAAQMMAQVLTEAIVPRRKPIAPPSANTAALQFQESVWTARIGSKVAPDWLTVFDDPLARDFKGTQLAGFYKVDDEGVPAERVSIVENGMLKGFLLSREPVRDLHRSNGHGRLPGGFGVYMPAIANLFVQPANPLSEAQLKAKLIEKVKSGGLKYGLIVRRIDFPSTSTIGDLQGLARQAQKSGYTRTLNEPLLVYRIWPDGREELIRGLRFQEFSAKDLRDLAAASDEPYVFNYLNNGSSFNWVDLRLAIVPSSVVCPSLLFDSVELSRAENEGNLPPLVPPPALAAQQ